MNHTSPDLSETKDEQPPIMGSWKRLYWLVMIVHTIFIILFYLLTQWYS